MDWDGLVSVRASLELERHQGKQGPVIATVV